jgi:hypothetical protein
MDAQYCSQETDAISPLIFLLEVRTLPSRAANQYAVSLPEQISAKHR